MANNNAFPAGFRVKPARQGFEAYAATWRRSAAAVLAGGRVDPRASTPSSWIAQGYADEDISSIYRLKSALFPK